MELKPGYKQTEIGVIPDEWTVDSLASVTPSNARHGIVDGPFGSNLKTIHYRKIGIPIITSGYVTDGHFSAATYLYVDKEKFEEEKRSAVRPGDIVMAKIGARCGASAILPKWHEIGILSGNALKISVDPLRHSTFYVWQVLWDLYSSGRIEPLKTTGAQPAISMANLKKYKVPLPPLPEQIAVAGALGDVDALIGGLGQLIAKKRDLKQAAMQQLLTGHKRLGGFTGRWEETTLGEIGECVIGLTYKPENVVEHGLLVLRSSNVQNGQLAFEDSVHVNVTVQDKLITREEDILICVRNGSRALIGKCAMIDERGAGLTFGAFMSIYRTKYSRFVFHAFRSHDIQRQIRENIGATINQITNKDMKAFRLSLPPEREQTAIAGVLSDMDAELAALEQRLAKTRALKQGMMQELLTGRTRLV